MSTYQKPSPSSAKTMAIIAALAGALVILVVALVIVALLALHRTNQQSPQAQGYAPPATYTDAGYYGPYGAVYYDPYASGYYYRAHGRYTALPRYLHVMPGAHGVQLMDRRSGRTTLIGKPSLAQRVLRAATAYRAYRAQGASRAQAAKRAYQVSRQPRRVRLRSGAPAYRPARSTYRAPAYHSTYHSSYHSGRH